MGDDVAAVRSREPVAKFLDWIRNKDPDFHVPTREKR